MTGPANPREDIDAIADVMDAAEREAGDYVSHEDLADLILNYLGTSEGAPVAIRAIVRGVAYRNTRKV